MTSSTNSSRSAVKQLVVVALLFLILVTLGLAYFFLTRPPQLEGQGEKDRNFLFSIYGFEGDLLRRPTGVGVDSEGNIHVADTGKRRIVVFDGDGNFISTYGDAGREPLKVWNPIDVAVAPDGTAFVVDKSQKKIVVYDPARAPVNEITIEEAPTQVTIVDESLFVTTESGVIIGDLEGNALTGYIKRGKLPGEFDRPGGVAVGEDGTLYIADSLNYRVQAISNRGEPIWQYGEPIPADKAIQFQGDSRKFGLPANIALDENGRLYVVDGLNSEVVVLEAATGERIETIGDVGHADGAFYYPDGIDYHDGRLIVADKFNDRVSVFSVPVPAGEAWRGYVPYAIPLLLLPLLFLLLRRGGRKYVVTPEFVGVLQADPDAVVVAEAMKKVHATPAVAESGEKLEELKLDWVKVEPDSQRVDEIVASNEIDRAGAEAVALAVGLKGKKVLVTDDQATASVARGMKVPVVTYEEIKDVLGKDEADADLKTEDDAA